MAIFEVLLMFLCIIFLYILRCRSLNKSLAPTHFPLVGMLPAILQNAHQLHDYATVVLNECGGTYEFKGPWFANMNILATCDPANIHHIMSKNFSNYPKGPEFKKIFDILGDGIFNSDSELWELHRKTTMSLMNHAKFHQVLEKNIWDKIENGLLPVLDHFIRKGNEINLQEIFQRFAFDSSCKLVLDYDPSSLSIDLPYIPCEKAFDDAAKALLHRHILPESLWKLEKWLGIATEKKLAKAWEAFDKFIYPCIPLKEEQSNGTKVHDEDFSLLTGFLKAYKGKSGASCDEREFMRDTLLSLIFAGRDTTSTTLTWFFWLIASNPLVELKILEEIQTNFHDTEDKTCRFFNAEKSRKLVYLHGAFCETLRLFPPVALEHKSPVRPDILPSGHCIPQNTKIILFFYSMGRMERIWGKDCLEFKPERWISEHGRIKHEPSFKFPAFNAGPRTCIGKEMSFVLMKIVAATMIYNYHVQLVEGQSVSPCDSVIIQMKHGLKVKLSKRHA
ncbi:alkane hydroxylase MAH1-like [Olea europaea subsp. europaea]|uniref:Alkane hydroxylase MAH1-like n=1 Tax=Olea europaea subsp. europaea TaxID=158383 RepID=A0A8S0SK62_OLEEU|nr:alkane hydroxylase MAH1-like [Olea europaea subsp. europaea]